MNTYTARLVWQYLLPGEDTQRDTQYEVASPTFLTAIAQAGVLLGTEYGDGGPVVVVAAFAIVLTPPDPDSRTQERRVH